MERGARRGIRTVAFVAVGLLVAGAAGMAFALYRSGTVAPDVAGVTDVSIGYGTLTVVQDGTDRLEIKAEPGVAPLTMARRDGNLLELGLADDADWRVLFMGLIPRLDPAAKLEFVLHTTSATRFAANDHGNIRLDGFKADELKISTMSVATVVARNIDVGALDVSFDGGASGSVVITGKAVSKTVFMNTAPVTYDDTGLSVSGGL